MSTYHTVRTGIKEFLRDEQKYLEAVIFNPPDPDDDYSDEFLLNGYTHKNPEALSNAGFQEIENRLWFRELVVEWGTSRYVYRVSVTTQLCYLGDDSLPVSEYLGDDIAKEVDRYLTPNIDDYLPASGPIYDEMYEEDMDLVIEVTVM